MLMEIIEVLKPQVETHKNKPKLIIISPAFADVNVNDSDFWCLQALGEAGIVSSRLSSSNSLSLSNIEKSNEEQRFYFSPNNFISCFDLDDNVLSDHYGPDWEKRIELKELHANVDQLCCLSRFYKKAYHQLFKSYDAAEVELRRMMEIINKLIANVLKKKPCHASKCKNKKKRGEKRKFSKEKKYIKAILFGKPVLIT
ncbi:hypothetical protein IEQ34_005099 [Dendrobium chrysotoxum]|uniref:Uncharacterized protein n=1 Tax=Dendrobium chrysotoxum TaxID=161865 RepID=A0AAV7H7X1_DENCH|nr:hypothetical protein IEQ34_005099 [Dendrobium chrysotoxum]